MKRKFYTLFAALLLSYPCGAQEVVGLWWISHGDGAPLQVRLYSDGTAWSDYPSNNPGTWTLQEGRVVCLWADGWKEILEPAKGGWRKLGFTPQTPLTAEPSNTSKAYRASSDPDGWYGISPHTTSDR